VIKPYYKDEQVTLFNCSCFDLYPQLESASISLIATDPPYMNVKDEAWDRQWKSPEAYIEWIGENCKEWQRILKPNGSLYCFASPEMAARVEVLMRQYFNVLSNISWRKEFSRHNQSDKDILRCFFPQTERLIFAEQYGCMYEDASKALHKDVYAPLGRYIQTERERAGLTRCEVEVALGFVSSSDPTKGTALCYRWEEGSSLPTLETYEKLRKYLNSKNGGDYLRREYEDLRREYEDLRREYEDLRREYEDLRRPFFATPSAPYTDVWDFPTVDPYPGKHPCEKPLGMMEHIIRISSRPGDTILDPFCGSGSTLQAARLNGRQAIGCELDAGYCEKIADRLKQGVLL
jgi:adenine-specific DNA-methyltransferase